MDATPDKLIDEVKDLLTDFESLLRQAAASTGDEAHELRKRADRALEQAQRGFENIQDDIVRRGKAGARATDAWVHHNPWSSIGVGAAVGLLIGVLIARR